MNKWQERNVESFAGCDMVQFGNHSEAWKDVQGCYGQRVSYLINRLNSKGEQLIVETRLVDTTGIINSMPEIWKKKGLIPEYVSKYYVFDVQITCPEVYSNTIAPADLNPTIIEGEGRRFINFDYIREATPEFLNSVLCEIETRFLNR